MTMKIWEVHASLANVPIRTTADGDADVGGLLLSEKAYLLAMRAVRPQELAALVAQVGAAEAAEQLIATLAASVADGTGRGLVLGRTRLGEPILRRNDEAEAPASAGRWSP